jgi:protein PhnA
MKTLEKLKLRSHSTCELCGAGEDLDLFVVEADMDREAEDNILICKICREQIENPEMTDPNHWRCLNESMWSEVPAVQVMAWRMLSRLKDEGWPQDLLDMIYLDEENLKWAQYGLEKKDSEVEEVIHKDVNGVILNQGDSVVLIKDLKVKGSSMIAKQGTAVRRITLDRENSEYIEGRVGASQIVILTKYVKKIS